MAIDWNKARQRMTDDTAYRGTGISRPRGPSRAQQRLGRRTGRSFGPAGGPIPTRQQIAKNRFAATPRGVGNYAKGIYNTAKAKGRKFVHPGLEMMGKFGDLVSGAMRGSRLHQAYQDDLGRVAGHKEWEKDKRSMMTEDEKAFEKKYLNLAAMAQDSETRDQHLATAETAWRNKQTSDRLAAVKGFEDYAPGKYTGVGEGSRYTGDVYKGQGRTGKHVPGYDIMTNLLGYGEGSEYAGPGQTIGAAGGPIPDMDITADLRGGSIEDDIANKDDYYTTGELWEDTSNDLYGEPKITEKPSFPFFPEDYEYPDERQLAPYSPLVDPFGGMYESPLTDRLYGEPTNIGLASEKALGERGFANPGGEGYTGPLPLISVELGPFDDDPITPNIADLDYFNQFTGRNFANPGGEEEEKIDPWWNKGRLGLYD